MSLNFHIAHVLNDHLFQLLSPKEQAEMSAGSAWHFGKFLQTCDEYLISLGSVRNNLVTHPIVDMTKTKYKFNEVWIQNDALWDDALIWAVYDHGIDKIGAGTVDVAVPTELDDDNKLKHVRARIVNLCRAMSKTYAFAVKEIEKEKRRQENLKNLQIIKEKQAQLSILTEEEKQKAAEEKQKAAEEKRIAAEMKKEAKRLELEAKQKEKEERKRERERIQKLRWTGADLKAIKDTIMMWGLPMIEKGQTTLSDEEAELFAERSGLKDAKPRDDIISVIASYCAASVIEAYSDVKSSTLHHPLVDPLVEAQAGVAVVIPPSDSKPRRRNSKGQKRKSSGSGSVDIDIEPETPKSIDGGEAESPPEVKDGQEEEKSKKVEENEPELDVKQGKEGKEPDVIIIDDSDSAKSGENTKDKDDDAASDKPEKDKTTSSGPDLSVPDVPFIRSSFYKKNATQASVERAAKKLLARVQCIHSIRTALQLPIEEFNTRLKKISRSIPANSKLPSWYAGRAMDKELVVGINRYGFGSWLQIAVDDKSEQLGRVALEKSVQDAGEDGKVIHSTSLVGDFPSDHAIETRLTTNVLRKLHQDRAAIKDMLERAKSKAVMSKDSKQVSLKAFSRDRDEDADMKDFIVEPPPAVKKVKTETRKVEPFDPNVEYVMTCGNIQVVSLGEIVSKKGFYSTNYLYPVGFESHRLHSSWYDPEVRVLYSSRIEDGGGSPVFVVRPADAKTDEDEFRGPSPTKVWCSVVEKVEKRKREIESEANTGSPSDRKERKSFSVSGPEYFGLSKDEITVAIEALPGVSGCKSYKMLKLRKIEKENRKRSTGNNNKSKSGSGSGSGSDSASSPSPTSSKQKRPRDSFLKSPLTPTSTSASSKESPKKTKLTPPASSNPKKAGAVFSIFQKK